MNNFKTEWDLEKYFFKSIDDPKIKETIDTYIKEEDKQIEYFKKNSIADGNVETLLAYYEGSEEISKLIYPVWLYYSYLSSIDSQNQEVLKKEIELENLSNDIQSKALFINEDFKSLGYDRLIELSEHESLKPFKNSIIRRANNLENMLSEIEERLIIEKDKGGANTLSSFQDELRSSFTFMYDGEERTASDVYNMRLDSDEEVRKKATMSIRGVYNNKQNALALSYIFRGLVKDKVMEDKIRGLVDVMATRNKREQLSPITVDTLLTTIRKNYGMYHKYMDIKSKLLQKDILNEWDRNAPYKLDNASEMNFEDGLNLYLDIIKDFDQEFYDYSVDMFTEGRVDVYPKKGKRSGAYAQYVKDVESFVLLNYTNSLDDVLTLAHELGHAMHGKLSQEQTSAVFSSPLSLAETASMFNETLVFDKLMETCESDEEKISMLVERLDGAFNTIFRQTQITLFEKEVHESFKNGKELNHLDLNEIWRRLTSELYGDNVVFDTPANTDAGWSIIPHMFRTPFYCYTYSFGNILSLSLYEMYKTEGDSFIPKYKEILKAGGSETPGDLLAKYDIDITDANFYQNGLNIVNDMMNQLDELVQKKELEQTI